MIRPGIGDRRQKLYFLKWKVGAGAGCLPAEFVEGVGAKGGTKGRPLARRLDRRCRR